MAYRASHGRDNDSTIDEAATFPPAVEAPLLKLPSRSRYALLLKRAIFFFGTRYRISPKNVGEAIDICLALDRHSIPSTLGKFSSPGSAPITTVQEFHLASDSLKNADAENSFYVTLKPPRLDFDPGYISAIASTALANGHGIHFDSHQHDIQEPTLVLLDSLIRRHRETDGPDRGWKFSLSVPSRWTRSLADTDWLADRGVRARLIKGEFKAPSPALEADPRENFLALIDRLAGRVPQIAIATHDCALAREGVLRARALGSPVEIELLFGIPATDILALARELAVPVRFYVPYGDTILMYGVQHFLTHPHKLLRPGSRDLIGSASGKTADIIKVLRT